MMQRERSDVYIIPPNFAKEGTLFSGRIEGRNAFEAAVLFIVLFRILFFIDVSIKIRIYIGIIVILPLTILAVVGVNGESLLSGGFKTEPKYRGMRFARFHEIQGFRKSDGITVCAQG